jgi:hypothetical protein
MGNTSLNDFIALQDATVNLDKDYATKHVELTGLKKNRDEKIRELSDLITRFRSGMRSTYGADSPQYAQAGGTPNSARKAPTRKKQDCQSPESSDPNATSTPNRPDS